jgi:peptidoglycan/LPS O-acetylase OafA/YrhL
LRGIAVLAVVLFHGFPGLLPGGLVGVDIFFVISGYLITSILVADFAVPSSRLAGVIADFYARRIRRLFPALVIVLAATYLLGFHFLLPSEFARLAQRILAGTGFCLNFLLAGQEDYFNPAALTDPLLHLWSLAVEEQFYLLWPLAIWIASRCRIRLLPLTVFLAATSFLWNSQRYEGAAGAAFYLPQMRMWELLLGGLAALLRPPLPDAGRAGGRHQAGIDQVLSALGFLLVGAGLVASRHDDSLPNGWTLLPTVGAACVVCSGGTAWLNRKVLAQRVLVGVGLISYPLYLWHWPLLSFAQIASGGLLSPAARAELLAAAAVLAWLTYRLVERPVRRGPASRPQIVACVAALAAVAAAALLTERAEGFPSRFPPLLSQIAGFRPDAARAVRQGAYFLIGDQDPSAFPVDPNERVQGRPTLYLWGDSHAAALYPGVSTVYGARFNIVQRTTAKTPPFLPDQFGPGNARDINQFVLDSIARDRPDVVMLEANWPEYDWMQVARTIRAVRASGARRVVLVGPVPQWIGTLPQQLFNYVRHHRDDPVPTRMTLGQDPRPPGLDRKMAALAASLGVEYDSPCSVLGNQDGFLVRTGEGAETLTTYDSSHLTVSASIYLVSHLPPL